MKNLLVHSLVIAVLGLGVALVVIVSENDSSSKENFFLSQWALTPDKHLSRAGKDLQNRAYERSMDEISKAIGEMKSIEIVTDAEGIQLVEKSIDYLLEVEHEIEQGRSDANHLEQASIECLNTLALIHLKLTEDFSEEGNPQKAMKSIRIAIKHMQNATDLAHLGSQRVGERLVIGELQVLLDSLEQHGHLNDHDYTLSANDLVKLIGSK